MNQRDCIQAAEHEWLMWEGDEDIFWPWVWLLIGEWVADAAEDDEYFGPWYFGPRR